MVTGCDCTTATACSFYLAIPTLGVATPCALPAARDQLTAARLGYLVLASLREAV